jgi:hypothetical protein
MSNKSSIAKITEKFPTQWQDAANFLLGLWLVVSPWVLAYADESTPAWNAAVLGAVIAIAAATALMEFQKWEEWITAVLASWLIVSPWTLGFSELQAATWNQVGVGVLVAILALWSAVSAQKSRGVAANS